jgi:sugar O-acyltransferase (sialic acid O-acetyltransferase NeuD family)
MNIPTKNICIVGAGGFAKEVLSCIHDIYFNTDISNSVFFMVKDDEFKEGLLMGIKVIPESAFDPSIYEVVVAVGDPLVRKKIISKLPKETIYKTLIHPSVIVSKWVEIGQGSIIMAGVIITCNITIGRHSHININSTIAHDCKIGEYFTTAPSVNISGNCTIGNNVYIGSNSSIKQGINIVDDVNISMGSFVIKDISESGNYISRNISLIKVQ